MELVVNMEPKEKLTVGFLILLSSLIGFGGSQYLSPEQMDDTYICPLNENIGIFYRLSTSGKTGYYYDTDGIETNVPCKSGRTWESWILLSKYIKDNNINIMENEEQLDIPISGIKEYICSPDGCVLN